MSLYLCVCVCVIGGRGGLPDQNNFVCHGHVTTLKIWPHMGEKLLQVKGEDETRLWRMADCCSSYHESTLSMKNVSGVLELEEPPQGRKGLGNMSFLMSPI